MTHQGLKMPFPTMGARMELLVLLLVAVLLPHRGGNGTLIASSEVQMCGRTSGASEPMFDGGHKCKKKFFVTVTVRSGQVLKFVFGLLS